VEPDWEGGLAELRAALGRKLLERPAERLLYRYDALLSGPAPRAVLQAESAADVQVALRSCSRHRLPAVARGGASGLSGGAVPTGPALVISTTRMTRVSIDPAGRLARVEPGVINQQLQELLRPHGLYYPPDPQSSRQATLGGNLAENAGGPQCFKKGVTGDYLLELEFVTADGQLWQMDRSGTDLPGLIVGSEGTLAVITGATLRLSQLPSQVRTARALFGKLEEAGRAVAEIIRRGLLPAKLELMDQASIAAVEQAFHLGLPSAAALLLCDCDGEDPEEVDREIAEVALAFRSAGALQVDLASNPAEAERQWYARRSVSPALGRIKPRRMNEDIVVPRSELPQVMQEIRALGDASGLPLVIFGHAGDGNLHPNIMYDPAEGRWAEVQALAHAIAKVAIAHGGALSGEHGIGLAKRPFMAEAVPQETLRAYRAVKRALDPLNLLNPGKILPEERPL
jgi:glycolate oxidase